MESRRLSYRIRSIYHPFFNKFTHVKMEKVMKQFTLEQVQSESEAKLMIIDDTVYDVTKVFLLYIFIA